MQKTQINIDDQLIAHLSTLSLLEFSEVERIGIKNDLKKLVAFCDKVYDFDAIKINPTITNSKTVLTNVYRDDNVKNVLEKSIGLATAENKNEDFFLVPKVIDK